jgi:hypothetical protein
MTQKTLGQFGLRIVIGLVLLLALREGLNLFEAVTRIPVAEFWRAIAIAIVCVFLPQALFHFYEIRRRA